MNDSEEYYGTGDEKPRKKYMSHYQGSFKKNKNWFEKLPLHWKLFLYYATGVLCGMAVMY